MVLVSQVPFALVVIADLRKITVTRNRSYAVKGDFVLTFLFKKNKIGEKLAK